ncbi:GGDEF domain-containing protein [Spongiibacter sp. KMU-158]|uniref:GGDEF domain-containing protein n=1 Tax=Spongiibacter pelagi TaxID=2760804 RepID=A0A927C1A4_9GAMM|nr:GGDEF domain-containing protein [Spongiibacter pelagi]MBD2859423.1 GGDEF domain-containing protein [Spongiibacter pelagi]
MVSPTLVGSPASSPSEFARRRFVSLFILGAMFVCGLVTTASIFMLPIGPIGQKLVRNYGILISVGSIISLVILEVFQHRNFALNTFLGFLCFGLAIITMNTGGIDAPGNTILVVMPTLATLSMGILAGALWACIVASFLCLLYWNPYSYLDIRNIIQPYNSEIGIFISCIAAIFLALLPTVYYELHQRKQRKIINKKHDMAVYHATHDPLTGLYNRRYFIAQLKSQICSDATEHFSVLYIDLNNFKPINDRYGHHIGDAVLSEVAKRLAFVFREQDYCCRMGGDEFAVLLKVSDKAEKDRFIERANAIFTEGVSVEEQYHPLSASIGCANYPKDGTSFETLIKQADKDMYAVKYRREIESHA